MPITPCWEANDVLAEGVYTGITKRMPTKNRDAISIKDSNNIWIHIGYGFLDSYGVSWTDGCIACYGRKGEKHAQMQVRFYNELYDKLLKGCPLLVLRNDIEVRIQSLCGSLPYTISGKIWTLPDARVDISGPNNYSATLKTEADGQFTKTVPCKGQYTVTASATDYVMQRRNVKMKWSEAIDPSHPKLLPESTKVTVGWPPAVYGIEFYATPNYHINVVAELTRSGDTIHMTIKGTNTGLKVRDFKISAILLNNIRPTTSLPLSFGDMDKNQSISKTIDFTIPGVVGVTSKQVELRYSGTYIKTDPVNNGKTGTVGPIGSRMLMP
jgi:hypothetical protein